MISFFGNAPFLFPLSAKEIWINVCVGPAAATCRGIALAKPEASREDGSVAN